MTGSCRPLKYDQQCAREGCSNAGLMCFAGFCRDCSAERAANAAPPPPAAEAHDAVDSPHASGKFAVLDVIEDWGLNYSRSCVIKHLACAGAKGDELEDLRNAAFYLQREIARLEAK